MENQIPHNPKANEISAMALALLRVQFLSLVKILQINDYEEALEYRDLWRYQMDIWIAW
jgi:hypothetical protein